MNDYSDIIDMSHHVSTVHKQMSLAERSAQFAPFSALTGYSDSIKETAIITESKVFLSSDNEEELSKKLMLLDKHIKEKPVILITYFKNDLKKQGGKYISENVIVKKIDKIEKKLILFDKTLISFSDIKNIQLNI